MNEQIEQIQKRWVADDEWARLSGEHRFLQADQHHVLEGLRHARQDVRALLTEVARLTVRLYDFEDGHVYTKLRREADYWHAHHEGDRRHAEGLILQHLADRDRARDAAVALEQENARLEERLKAAEDACLMYGWSTPGQPQSDRSKAAYELWARWFNLVGDEFTSPGAHPDLSDEVIEQLARQRDEKRATALAKLRGETR